jgi:hypothetical protein
MRDFFERRNFASASENSLATSNASLTLLFLLAMNSANALFPSRFAPLQGTLAATSWLFSLLE